MRTAAAIAGRQILILYHRCSTYQVFSRHIHTGQIYASTLHRVQAATIDLLFATVDNQWNRC
jgi:hypothetical protein